MENGIFFSIISLFYCIFVNVLFFMKKKIKSQETKIYGILLIINLIGLFIEIFPATIAIRGIINVNREITIFFLKLILIYLASWLSVFTYYIVYLSLKDKKIIEKIKRLVIFEIIIVSLFIMILPLDFYIENGAAYSFGLASNFVYIFSLILIVVCLFFLITNIKNIGIKKYYPLITFFVLGIIVIIIQYFNPELTLMLSLHTYVLMVMYFTIENPDMKLLEEIHKSKEISDNANEEKALFLYNMTQEIRNTTRKIDENVDYIIESNNFDDGKELAREIKNYTSDFRTMINEIMNIDTIEASSVKVYKEKYNLKNLLKEITKIYSEKCKKKEIEFRINFDHNIPDILYGDSINLKKVLTTVLDYSLNNTSKGFIELSVNCINKKDISRLIITVEDSSDGIRSYEIGKLKLANSPLGKANNLLNVMGGTIIITSDYGLGLKSKLILDQKVELEVIEEIKKYEDIFTSMSILIVDDSEATPRIFEKLLKNTNTKIDYANNGKETIEKLKSGNKYNYIFIDEELRNITGKEVLYKIKQLRNFNIPVILLTKDNSYEYNEEYKKVGFSGYILKPINKQKILEVITNKDEK